MVTHGDVATGVYVDGMNLFYGALKGTSDKWLDLRAFVHLLVPDDEIVAIHYFTARVRSRPGQDDAAQLQSIYLRALRYAGGVTIHEGNMVHRARRKSLDDRAAARGDLFVPAFRPRVVFEWMWRDSLRRRGQRRTGLATVMIEEEKRTDVNIAVQMVEDSARGLVDKILLVSNDSDLTEAVLATERFGVPVGIVNPHRTRTSHHLTGSASFEIVLRRTALTRCQFPNVVNGPNGRSVRRPTQWL